MGVWILREACREAASWPVPLQIAVNLSPAQFMHGDLVGLVHSILIETGLQPDRLELEITEGVLIEDFERGLVLPDRFIPLAEETGLIVPIGEWVLWNAARQAARWRAMGKAPVVVSVNLSARQLWVGGLMRCVSAVIQETGMAEYLELELTESMVMHDAEAVIATLQGLRSIGVRLSLDDFGTGYSSLSYLRRLPLNALKIDGSFVRDIQATGGPDDGILAKAMISLGHSLRLKVVAEGVETQEQRGFLAAHDCDEMQGFLYAKPCPAAECQRFLR